MNRKNLTEAELQELLLRMKKNYTYDAKSGKLVNKQTGRMVKGVAKDTKSKYICFFFWSLGMVRYIYYHAAVWAWHKGCFPTMQLDHIDLDPTNNRIENLREVSGSENKKNTLYPWRPNADTGLPGVCICHGSYQIKVAQKLYYFRDKYEAFCNLTLLGRRFK